MSVLVEVYVLGGVVQDIRKPDYVNVVVYDGDIEGVAEEDISLDPDGDRCVVTHW